jgi:hypothetical protein
MNLRLLILAATSTLILACSSKPEQLQDVADCVFADGSNQAAPQWVCGNPVEGLNLSAVGYADKSLAGPNFMRQMAATSARVELAQTLKVNIQNMIKQYAETTGAGDSETIDKVNTSVTKQITKETLIGSRIFKQRPTPTGGLVVLVGLDPDTANQIAEEALKTSMHNEKAIWQKLQANKGQEELAKAIIEMNQ